MSGGIKFSLICSYVRPFVNSTSKFCVQHLIAHIFVTTYQIIFMSVSKPLGQVPGRAQGSIIMTKIILLCQSGLLIFGSSYRCNCTAEIYMGPGVNN